ncbi:serine hydrolase [Nakamurella sp.]|uniref:serine hydrolase n=1 Tax=Nakamurella sp. TaxID=1869182 RepID=UPI003B3A8770
MPAPTDLPAPAAPPVSPRPGGNRDPLVDALRSVALARVVLWHAFAAPWLSWIFPAMPVMFFLAGAVLAGSVARPVGSRRTADRSAGPRTLARRLLRILLPFWVYSATVVAITALRPTVFGPGSGPGPGPVFETDRFDWPAVLLPLPRTSGTDRDWLTGHLWYLTDYLVLLVLLPVAAMLARRVRAVVAGALAGLVALELAPLLGVPSLVGTARMAAGDLLCYGLFAVLGVAWATRRPAPPDRRAVLVRAAAGLALVAATLAGSVVVPLPRGSLNESYLLLAVAALGWLLLIGAAEQPLRRLAATPRVAPAARAVSARALTIYLWHPAAIFLALALAPAAGLWSAPSVLLLTVGFTAAAVAAVGWVEDVAARRPARWWPTGAHRTRTGPDRPPQRLRLAVAAAAAVTLIAGTTTAVTAGRTEGGLATLPPPSDRTALADTAFAAAARDLRAGIEDRPLHGDDLQSALELWIAAQPEINDAVVSVAAGPQVWSGSATRAGGEPPAAEFSVGIASMTKTFTASLVVQLAEEGRLDLDAPVPDLPDVQPLPAGETVTPRQLLQHATGLIQYTDSPGYDAGRVYTAGELVSLSIRAPRAHAADAGVTYSNSNYLWLGLLLESVTGSAYGSLLAERITGPLGLATVDVPVDERTGWVGSASGGVSATPADVARFFDALVNRGELLSLDAVHRMTDLSHLNGGLGIWPLCPCGQTEDGAKWASGLGHFNGDGAAFAFPDDRLAVYLRIGGPGDPPVPTDRMIQMREELMELMRTTAVGASDPDGPDA